MLATGRRGASLGRDASVECSSKSSANTATGSQISEMLQRDMSYFRYGLWTRTNSGIFRHRRRCYGVRDPPPGVLSILTSRGSQTPTKLPVFGVPTSVSYHTPQPSDNLIVSVYILTSSLKTGLYITIPFRLFLTANGDWLIGMERGDFCRRRAMQYYVYTALGKLADFVQDTLGLFQDPRPTFMVCMLSLTSPLF